MGFGEILDLTAVFSKFSRIICILCLLIVVTFFVVGHVSGHVFDLQNKTNHPTPAHPELCSYSRCSEKQSNDFVRDTTKCGTISTGCTPATILCRVHKHPN